MSEPGEKKMTDEEIVEEIRQKELAKLPVLRRPCLIEDGYTIPGAIYKIIEKDELGIEVGIVQYNFEFEFRPLNSKERKKWTEVPEKEYEEHSVNMLVERISTWNLQDDKGQSLTINKLNMHRLSPDLQEYLIYLILCVPSYPNQAEEKYTGNVGRKIKVSLPKEAEAARETREFADTKN